MKEPTNRSHPILSATVFGFAVSDTLRKRRERVGTGVSHLMQHLLECHGPGGESDRGEFGSGALRERERVRVCVCGYGNGLKHSRCVLFRISLAHFCARTHSHALFRNQIG